MARSTPEQYGPIQAHEAIRRRRAKINRRLKLKTFETGRDPEGKSIDIGSGPSWSGQYLGSYPSRGTT
jgi:hypothetical protein